MNSQNRSMGRRPTVNLNLPKGMRARVQKSGRVFYYLDTGAKPRKELPLGPDYTEAVRQWAELTVTATAPAVTFRQVAERYQREVIPTKAPRTQKDNLTELQNLYKFFDDPPCNLDEIEPLHVRQYLDWRGATAKVRANREKALLSHIWNYARERGLTALANPCKGVKGYKEPGRDVYINDDVFSAVKACASQAVRDAMDLAYLTGQRPADTLKMRETDIRDGTLAVKQGKGGKKLRLMLTKDGVPNALGRLIETFLERKRGGSVRNLALIISKGGYALTTSGLDNGFERARIKAAAAADQGGQADLAERIRGFQFRDLRAKAGTEKADSDGLVEAKRQLGHSSVKMTEHYVRLGQIVTPTK
ncbi:site-specific recombinase XerD [Nitrosospira sp. Nsp2]|uniref:tyrosine-type recombinase/integrase n=1 Tax=Nitrosospira sp. Nsp2 TaxID=136548 RepID=UPI000D45AE1D|nr:tyrosine-type recombinase/integrase [Nitrosospira sp. Nsp2]PTR17460.1 site-specific recombinase XerD [Nitrosospira sp. Nsp2]